MAMTPWQCWALSFEKIPSKLLPFAIHYNICTLNITIHKCLLLPAVLFTNDTITGRWCPYKECETAPDPTQSVHCPVEEDSVWRIQWPATAADSIQTICCPGLENTSGLGLAHRNCLVGGVWGSVDATECESVAIRTVRMKVLQSHVECVNACTRNVHVSWNTWPFNLLQTNKFVSIYKLPEAHWVMIKEGHSGI